MDSRVWQEVLKTVIGAAAALGFVIWYRKRYYQSVEPSAALTRTAAPTVTARTRADVVAVAEGHEKSFQNALVFPEDIDVHCEDIGGLQDVINTVVQNIIEPINHPELFAGSKVLGLPRGVLLHGPPGTGKTMLAKALAKQSGACFICGQPSTLLSKFFGESQKLVSALFSLARKLQPAIIFLDEADGILGRVGSGEQSQIMDAVVKQILQLWEGMHSMPHDRVIILAATNRKDRLDEAVLRRFDLQLEVGLPNALAREQIVRNILRTENVDRILSRNEPEAGLRPLQRVAQATQQYCGSDLRDLVKAAVMRTVRHPAALPASPSPGVSASGRPHLRRLLTLRDFEFVLQGGFMPASRIAQNYHLHKIPRTAQQPAWKAAISHLQQPSLLLQQPAYAKAQILLLAYGLLLLSVFTFLWQGIWCFRNVSRYLARGL